MEVAVDGGTKVEEKEFLVSIELLMKQLLKLDSIEAEGEAKLQRKAEVSILGHQSCNLDVLSVLWFQIVIFHSWIQKFY